MSRVITEIASPLARDVMTPHGQRSATIDALAKAAYEGHGIGLYGPTWDDLGDAQQERWRWTVCAVLRAAHDAK
jgi:hypothetical protein